MERKGDLAWFACPGGVRSDDRDAGGRSCTAAGTSAPDFTRRVPLSLACHTNGNLFARQAFQARRSASKVTASTGSYARARFEVVLFAPEGLLRIVSARFPSTSANCFSPVDIRLMDFDAALRRTEAVFFSATSISMICRLSGAGRFLCTASGRGRTSGRTASGESCEDDGIQGVRFCKPPVALAKSLTWRGLTTREAGRAPLAGNRCFGNPPVASSTTRAGWSPNSRFTSDAIPVRRLAQRSGGQHSHVQIRLGDVYTDKTFTLHHSSSFSVPALLMRALSPDNCSGSLRNGCDATRSLTASCDQGEDGLSHPVAYGYQYLLT